LCRNGILELTEVETNDKVLSKLRKERYNERQKLLPQTTVTEEGVVELLPAVKDKKERELKLARERNRRYRLRRKENLEKTVSVHMDIDESHIGVGDDDMMMLSYDPKVGSLKSDNLFVSGEAGYIPTSNETFDCPQETTSTTPPVKEKGRTSVATAGAAALCDDFLSEEEIPNSAGNYVTNKGVNNMVASPLSVEFIGVENVLTTPNSTVDYINRQTQTKKRDKSDNSINNFTYISNRAPVEMTIKLTETEITNETIFLDIAQSGLMKSRLSVSQMFQDSVTASLLNPLKEMSDRVEDRVEALKKKKGDKKKKDDEEIKLQKEAIQREMSDFDCIRTVLRLGEDKTNYLNTIEVTVDGQDILSLIQDKFFLCDTPIEYYRCMLLKEEMKRALTLHKEEWRRSWIHGTFFMTLYYKYKRSDKKEGELITDKRSDKKKGEWITDYDSIKAMERRYLGNSTSFVI